MNRETEREIRRRQNARATIVALLLGAFVVLIFGIAIVKIRQAMHDRPDPAATYTGRR